MLSLSSLRASKAFTKYPFKPTQTEFYQTNGAPAEILKLVSLESKSFGSVMERLIVELFELGKRSSSQNDGVKYGKKMEIKVARYWVGSKNCKWQHLEKDHDYEMVLFVLLDFDEIKVWSCPKKLLMGELLEKKIVKHQGKQGYWVEMNAALPYLTPIRTQEELEKACELI